MPIANAGRVVAVLFWTMLLGATLKANAAESGAKAQLDKILADHWEWQSKEFPERSTFRGDHRFNDRLTDWSEAAALNRRAYQKSLLDRFNAIDARALKGQDRLSWDVLRTQMLNAARINKVYMDQPGNLPFGAYDDWVRISTMGGPNSTLIQLSRASPFQRVSDYDNYLKRLAAYPTQLAALQKWMERGMAAGWVAPAISMQRVPGQLDVHIGEDARKLAMFQPFVNFPADIAENDRNRLTQEAVEVISKKVVPAFRTLQSFVREKYLPAGKVRDSSLGASTLPAGPAYYAAMIANSTTTTMSAKEVHELGLREVARIIAEMDRVIALTGFKGTRAEFNQFVRTDPRFFYTKAEDMLAGYRDIAKRADAELPRFFAELPRQPYGIRAMLPSEGDSAEHYTAGAADGSRAGYFEANVNNLQTRSKNWMEVLVMHEAVPGHHLQVARAQELKDLPPARKFAGFTAYSEGWGLYSESLGEEMGFYKDPYSKYGQLSAEMHRAARLVVDSGIHAMGWGRDQTIKYLMDNAALAEGFATAETDRYILWPGQALAYKVGELKIKSLRQKAKAALGEEFEVRRFHNAILDNGALPLDVLEQQIDLWIAGERRAVAAKKNAK